MQKPIREFVIVPTITESTDNYRQAEENEIPDQFSIFECDEHENYTWIADFETNEAAHSYLEHGYIHWLYSLPGPGQ